MNIIPDMNGTAAILPRALETPLRVALASFPVVVNATARPRLADTKSLQLFRSEYKERSLPGRLRHTGTDTAWIADGVLATPWWRVL